MVGGLVLKVTILLVDPSCRSSYSYVHTAHGNVSLKVRATLSVAGLSPSLHMRPRPVWRLDSSHFRRPESAVRTNRRLMDYCLHPSHALASVVSPLHIALVLPFGQFFPPTDYYLSYSD